MKVWAMFALGTIICWGAYVPILHAGQTAFGGKPAALRAFMCVGLAYFVTSIAVLIYVVVSKVEPLTVTPQGMTISTSAGMLGAIGALCIVLALMNGGRPMFVAPIVFAGAPLVNTLVSMLMHKPKNPPSIMFFVGILLAGVGAALILRFKPT